jgi:hypothetical protein
MQSTLQNSEAAMEDPRGEATGALAEIAAVERRTKAAIAYRRASAFLILWGALVTIGAALNQILPDRSEVIWYGVDAIGLVGTCLIALRRARHGALDRRGWEIIASFLVLGAYGVAWSYLLAPAGHDRLAVFWSTLMMMGYVVAGLWRGPFFAVCGLVGRRSASPLSFSPAPGCISGSAQSTPSALCRAACGSIGSAPAIDEAQRNHPSIKPPAYHGRA